MWAAWPGGGLSAEREAGSGEPHISGGVGKKPVSDQELHRAAPSEECKITGLQLQKGSCGRADPFVACSSPRATPHPYLST